MAYEKKGRRSASKDADHKDGGYRKEGYGREGGRPFKGRSDRPRNHSEHSRERSGSDRPERRSGPRDARPRRDFDRNDRGKRPFGSRGRDDSRSKRDFHKEPHDEEPRAERKLNLPQDASRLLYRGIDCQVKGDINTAMIMFLHGSVMMSEGCENNADRILGEIGKAEYVRMRTDIGPSCSEDALTEYDFLCIRRSKSYDRTFFDSEYSKKTTHAIYRSICLEEVEGNDPIIDEFASRYPDDEKKVVEGLQLLKRKKDSASAEKHLQRIEESVELKRTINVLFTRAMNGDAHAVKELKRHSSKVPEAAFYSEYLAARAEGNEVEWLRAKYPSFKDLIISRQGEFKIQSTPFGMFLKAKNLEMRKEEWMSVMMNAAKAGSPEAMDELSSKMFRADVRKCLAGIYLKNDDLQNLLIVYQAGLDDMYYLDQYCGDSRERILEVGSELGKQSIGKEIDWLKDHYENGMEFCRQALVDLSMDDRYRSKKMIYALHDTGCDREAAELYFAMEGDPELPSVKWLKKVCTDDDVKEYVRRHYEEKGEPGTFDSIFEDDGYERRPKRQNNRSPFGRKQGGGRPRKDRR